jgi:hypothetical protein
LFSLQKGRSALRFNFLTSGFGRSFPEKKKCFGGYLVSAMQATPPVAALIEFA